MASGWKVHGNNPGKAGEPPRAGAISHTFAGESLPTFFWASIRSGLLPVIMK